MNKCIILPPGHGKSSLGKVCNFVVNIDSLHTEEQRIDLGNFLAKHDYIGYIKQESVFLKNRIKNVKRKILLVHCQEQAEIYGLKILGNFKLYKKEIQKIIKERESDPRTYRAKNTLVMWEANKNAEKCKSFKELEQKINKILCTERLKYYERKD
jgi:hypothetical protein